MTDHETIAAYDARVDAYAGMTKRQKPDPSLLSFIARIPAGGHVLDLGCGPAQASAEMRAQGLDVDPVDASPEMVRLANETYDIGARQAVFEDIDGTGVYDGIWANFSLLHAAPEDFPGHLSALARALKPGGTFHIGMKLGSGSARDSLGRRYAYFSQEELSAHLSDAGFVTDEVTTGKDKGLAGDIEPWITILARV